MDSIDSELARPPVGELTDAAQAAADVVRLAGGLCRAVSGRAHVVRRSRLRLATAKAGLSVLPFCIAKPRCLGVP